MIDILESIDRNFGELADPFRKRSVDSAVSPGLFLFVGRAVEKCGYIKEFLAKHWINSSKILYAGIGADSDELSTNIEFVIPDDFSRGEIGSVLLSDPEALKEFNDEVSKLSTELMKATGFADMSRAFVFIITYADDPLNTVVPEITMLLREKCHFNVKPYLFVNFADIDDENAHPLEYSAAFIQELEHCQSTDFNYTCKIRQQGNHLLDVEQNGPTFESTVLLELFRKDKKFSRENEKENGTIAAMMMFLLNSRNKLTLPEGTFITAGYSIVTKPNTIISHVLFKALLEKVIGIHDGSNDGEYIARMFDTERISTIVNEELSREMPSVNEIISVLPGYSGGGNPAKVSNTSVGTILEYYGGADEEYFERRFVEYFRKKALNIEPLNIKSIIKNAIDSEQLTPCAAMKALEDGGVIQRKLSELLEEYTRSEERILSELNALLESPCANVRNGIFNRTTGCEIISQAVQQKYNKRIELEICRIEKSIIEQNIHSTHSMMAKLNEQLRLINDIKTRFEDIIVSEIAEAEYTLADPNAFSSYYTSVVEGAFKEYVQRQRKNGVIEDGSLYNEIMNLTKANGDSLLRLIEAGFKRLASTQKFMEIFQMSFDAELYARYGSTTQKDGVNSELLNKLMDESCANLRYDSIGGTSSMYCIGSSDIPFVEYASKLEGQPFSITHIEDTQKEYYEQLMVYGNVEVSAVKYVKDCNQLFENMSEDEQKNTYFKR